jgi:hypothetical protein
MLVLLQSGSGNWLTVLGSTFTTISAGAAGRRLACSAPSLFDAVTERMNYATNDGGKCTRLAESWSGQLGSSDTQPSSSRKPSAVSSELEPSLTRKQFPCTRNPTSTDPKPRQGASVPTGSRSCARVNLLLETTDDASIYPSRRPDPLNLLRPSGVLSFGPVTLGVFCAGASRPLRLHAAPVSPCGREPWRPFLSCER